MQTLFMRENFVVWRTIEDEGVLLNIGTNVYYSVNESGLAVWRLLETPRTFEALLDGLLSEYEADSETCRRDLTLLLGDLEQEGLIKREDRTG